MTIENVFERKLLTLAKDKDWCTNFIINLASR